MSVTYRLGLFGFLGIDGVAPSNLGLLDQIQALRWVQANIGSFGGDKENVTVFGQSAGGDAIAHLMIADGTEGLFRRAIIQSAPLGISRGRARMSASMAGRAGSLSATATSDQLVDATSEIVKGMLRFGLRGAMPFGEEYGRAPMPPERAAAAAWRRAAENIDVMIGSTRLEASLFVPTSMATPLRRALVAGLTGRLYERPARAFARRHAEAGGRGYRYLLSWGPQANPFRAAHTTDLPLLFFDRRAWEAMPTVTGVSWSDVDRDGREVRRLWAAFARTGCPPEDSGGRFLRIEAMRPGARRPSCQACCRSHSRHESVGLVDETESS